MNIKHALPGLLAGLCMFLLLGVIGLQAKQARRLLAEEQAAAEQKAHIDGLKNTQARDWIEYVSLEPKSIQSDLGSDVYFVSGTLIKRVPVTITWNENIDCDMSPDDGVSDYSHFASSVSSRAHTELRLDYEENLWPFRVEGGGEILRGPTVPAECILISHMSLDVGHGVILYQTEVTEPFTFGNYAQ